MSRISDEEWQHTIDRLSRHIVRFQHAYYYAEPLISDAEFDVWYRKLQALENTRPHLKRINSPTNAVQPTAPIWEPA